jgi:hypothetical protein
MRGKRRNTALIAYTTTLGLLQFLFLPLFGVGSTLYPFGEFVYGFEASPMILAPALALELVGIDIWDALGPERFTTVTKLGYGLAYIGVAGGLYSRPSRRLVRVAEAFFVLNLGVFVLIELLPNVEFSVGRTLTYVGITGVGVYLTEVSGDRWLLKRFGGTESAPNGDQSRSAGRDRSSDGTPSNPDPAGGSAPEAVRDSLERGDALRNAAEDRRESGAYDEALDTVDEARDAYRTALDTASEGGEDIDTAEVERRLAAVEGERRQIHRQRLRDEIRSLRAELDRADTRAADALDARLAAAAETASEHGFDDLHEEIRSLERRHEERRDAVDEGRRIPTEIPRAPAVSVEYDALTDVEPIGGGGNADVTKATVATPDGDVTLAIKEPRTSGTLHADHVERLLQEAETWDRLDDHDHVVGVVDYGSDPLPWIAMEYMDGGHLGARSGEMEFQEALWTAIAVTKGVRHAHTRGVAHLDLKPENVLFRTVADAWDVPKVADWGLSKHLLEHSKSVDGMSPGYAAPEQFETAYGPTDNVTDVYGLGAVFYELFTGRPPFEGRPTQVMRAALEERPTPPSEVADVPAALDDVLLTALAKEKADRYEDALYLRDDLQALFDSR